ncbi:26965_t:CDS:2, partial [Dentiscutata erythropus]
PERLQWVDVSKIIKSSKTSQVLVDGAYNPSAAKALRKYVDKQLQLQNKEITKTCNLLMRNGDSLFAVSFTNIEEMPWNSKVVENLDEVLHQTFASYDEQSQIVVLCGSLYLISDLFRMLQ